MPRVLHWGPALPDLDGDLSAGLLAGLAPPVPHSAADVPVPRRLVPLPGDGWRLRPGLRGSRPDGTGWSPHLRVAEVHAAPSGLEVTADDAALGLRLTAALTLHPSGVLEVVQTLTNTGDAAYVLTELAATLPLPLQPLEVLDLTGRWSRERTPQRHPLLQGAWVRESRHGRTGHGAPHVLHVGTPGFGFRSGEVWAVHLGWSGDSTYWAERNPQGHAQLGVAELLSPGEVVLQPGGSYTAPPAYAAHSTAGLDGVSRAFHAYVRARPGHPVRPRPVLLNTWEAVYFDHDSDRLVQLADTAAAVGVERFVLDDGWFGDRRGDTAGLGDWTVSPAAWPGGLGPLIEHVRGLGMEFGLWVEPEMVNPDSALHRAHPDWVLAAAERSPSTWRSQHVLDLARPEVFAHVLSALDALLREHDIAYLKWDHNRDLVDAEHAGRAGVRSQTLAVYALLDELRRRHPGVEVESCASGGGRVDLGVLARTDRVWPSDTNDALERQTIQRWTCQLLPPELVGTHVGDERSHTTGRRSDLSFRAATALFGHLGVEWDLTRASAQELDGLREAVALHKRLRALLHGGEVVRADGLDPQVLVHGVVADDRGEAVFAYVQLDTVVCELPAPLRLPGLDPSRHYRVQPLPLAGGPRTQQVRPPGWPADGVVLPGRVLEVVGLVPPLLAPEQALLVHVRAT